MPNLKMSVEKFVSLSETHAYNSSKLIEDCGLEIAVEYCKLQRIDPPQCSFTAVSKNADMLRDKARRMLSDDKWWARRLKMQAIQGHEMYHIMNEPTMVSNELISLMKKSKR